MLRTWAADAHDARLLGLQCWLALMLAHLVLNAKDLGG